MQHDGENSWENITWTTANIVGYSTRFSSCKEKHRIVSFEKRCQVKMGERRNYK
jgi:hypothetical protein